MAKRIILQSPDPILFKKCRPVEVFDERLHTLLDDMRETLEDADGAGLAAPQVAVLKRVCIVSTEDGFYELINPEIKSASGEQTKSPSTRSTATAKRRNTKSRASPPAPSSTK